MKHKFVALIILTLLYFSPQALADTDPTRAFATESVSGAKKLASILSGTSWYYHYEGRDFLFYFNPSGRIDRLKYWPNVRWRVISPTEVLLDRPDGGSMLIRFNENATSFQCLDWTTKPATGSPVADKSSGGSTTPSYFGAPRS